MTQQRLGDRGLSGDTEASSITQFLKAAAMNLIHRWLCRSAHWKTVVETHILPWVLDDVDLGPHVMEVGPGPGITTDLLRTRVESLTCVEIDRTLADSLSRRMAGRNVTVLCEDATAIPLPDETFDGAVSFTMLHHVPSAALQDRLLAEVARVLRPGGIFAGTDSISSPLFRLMHVFDTMVVVNPDSLPERLEAAGFADVQVDVNPYAFRFRARRVKGSRIAPTCPPLDARAATLQQRPSTMC